MSPVSLIKLMDLTNLDERATAETIAHLCKKAVTSFGPVAAICIYPSFLTLARQHLKNIPLATVVNFPQGRHDLPIVLSEIEAAILLGADEIDVVIPYHFYLSQERNKVREFLAACRKTCHVKLKMILETGALHSTEYIAAASNDAIDAGVDFIKTSTGKIPIGATLDAAAVMLATIKSTGSKTGFKASGGIRHRSQANAYLQLAIDIMGKNWITPDTFRFGASTLLDELCKQETI
ncbi:MAG: deoxyribose-phosphate aldolase [Gammaproteobacteria bacterium]